MKKFYLGMNRNSKSRSEDGHGAIVAVRVMRALEKATGAVCTARWPWSEHENIGLTCLFDIARADFVILAPLNDTARGTHVEMGAALALDKPTYLYPSSHRDPTHFDRLCLPLPETWRQAIEIALALVDFARQHEPEATE